MASAQCLICATTSGRWKKALKNGNPVYLTKNGYGSMVVMSLEHDTAITQDIEQKLDETDKAAEVSPVRHSPQEVFSCAKERIPR